MNAYILRKPTFQEAVESVWENPTAMQDIEDALVEQAREDGDVFDSLLVTAMDAAWLLSLFAEGHTWPQLIDRYGEARCQPLRVLLREAEVWAKKRQQMVCDKAQESLA